MDGQNEKPTNRRNAAANLSYAAQCAKCLKWCKIDTQEEYMEINRTAREDPYVCEKKEGVSCEDGGDKLKCDSTRAWIIDTPGLPKIPRGFTRRLVMRWDKSKLDVYYIAPDGTRLRSRTETKAFLETNQDFKYASMEDFDFQLPVMMKNTI